MVYFRRTIFSKWQGDSRYFPSNLPNIKPLFTRAGGAVGLSGVRGQETVQEDTRHPDVTGSSVREGNKKMPVSIS